MITREQLLASPMYSVFNPSGTVLTASNTHVVVEHLPSRVVPTTAETSADSGVLREAMRRGFVVSCFGARPISIDNLDAMSFNGYDMTDAAVDVINCGFALIVLPDTMGSQYRRYYFGWCVEK